MKESLKRFYVDVAKRVSLLSHAEKLKVGAIAVKDGRIIGEGVNGTPIGWEDNICEYKIYQHEELPGSESYPYIDDTGIRYRLKTKEYVLHAEANCIMKMARHGQSTKDAFLFCNIAPCMECAKLISMAEIKKVYYAEEYRNRNGLEFLMKCNIEVEKIDE